MKALFVVAAGWAAMFGAGAVQAGELSPVQGASLQLGQANGIVFYTDEPDGYRVVATLTQTPQTAPVRFIAMLKDGQTVTLSVGQAVDQPALEVKIRRIGNHLFIDDGLRTARAEE